MDDKTKLLLAVIISVVGILILFIISQFVKIEPIKISDIDDMFVGKTVLINGTITKVSDSERTIVFVDNSSTPLVIFSKINLTKNKEALITGRVDEYNDGLQIIVDKIEIIN